MNDGISLIELILNASLPFSLSCLFFSSFTSWVIIVQRWLVLSAEARFLVLSSGSGRE